MQAMGFAFAMMPALRKICKDKGEFLKAVKRHMEFFNTHPYMASLIIGTSIKLEEDIKDGIMPAEAVSQFKKSLMGPYGAIGDMYYWGSIKPMAALSGVILAFLSVGIWASAAFLIIYNIMHLWMRFKGVSLGYYMGTDVVEYIKSFNMPDWSKRVRYFTVFLTGVFLALYEAKGGWRQVKMSVFSIDIIGLLILPAAVICLMWLMKKGVSVSIIVYAVFIINVLYWHI